MIITPDVLKALMTGFRKNYQDGLQIAKADTISYAAAVQKLLPIRAKAAAALQSTQVKTTSIGKFGKTFSVSDARLASALIRVNSSVSGIGCSTL